MPRAVRGRLRILICSSSGTFRSIQVVLYQLHTGNGFS